MAHKLKRDAIQSFEKINVQFLEARDIEQHLSEHYT